jgi:hypothetical protein
MNEMYKRKLKILNGKGLKPKMFKTIVFNRFGTGL